MASSGTLTFVNSTFDELIVEAYERLQIFGDALSGVHLDSARRSANYVFADWANQQPNLWTVDQQTQALDSSSTSYNLASGTIAVMEAAIRDTTVTPNVDTPISPISRQEYLSIASKSEEAARPTVYYVERALTPKIYIWPVPDDTGQTLVYNRVRMLYDVSELLTESADLPNRLMEAFVSALAAKLAVKWRPERAEALHALAAKSYALAIGEDRERVPLRIMPNLMGWG